MVNVVFNCSFGAIFTWWEPLYPFSNVYILCLVTSSKISSQNGKRYQSFLITLFKTLQLTHTLSLPFFLTQIPQEKPIQCLMNLTSNNLSSSSFTIVVYFGFHLPCLVLTNLAFDENSILCSPW